MGISSELIDELGIILQEEFNLHLDKDEVSEIAAYLVNLFEVLIDVKTKSGI